MLLIACFPLQGEENRELLSLQQVWNARISLKDVQGAVNLYDTFVQIKADSALWTEEELTLITKTLQMRFDLAELHKIHQLLTLGEPQSKRKLRIVQERSAWTTLLLAMQSGHPKRRAEAMIGAVKASDGEAIPLIVAALFDENRNLREYALEIARFFPDRSIQQIVEERSKKSQNRAERLQSILVLQDQGDPLIESIITEFPTKEMASPAEKALITLLQIELQEKNQKDQIPLETLTKLAESSQQFKKKALLLYAEKRRSKEVIDLLIRKILLNREESIDILAHTLTIVGCNKDLIDQYETDRRQKILLQADEYASRSIDLLSIRALWFLSLFNETKKKALSSLVQVLQSEKSPMRCNDLIAHIRALGQEGIDAAHTIFDLMIEKKISIPRGAQMTIALYLLEQNSIRSPDIALFLWNRLTESKESLSLFDNRLGAPFEVVIENRAHVENTLICPIEKELQDLAVQERLMKAAFKALSNPIPADDIFSFFQQKMGFMYQTSSIQFLANELTYSPEELAEKIIGECFNDDQKIGFALVLAEMESSDRAISIIEKVLENKNKPKKTLEMALYALSQFQIDRVESLIIPYLFHKSESIRIQASACYLSSITQ